MPREIGKLTPEQLVKEREARAAREEAFRRICVEVEATGSTFEQAASQLGLPQPMVEYFQMDRETAKAAWTKGFDHKPSNPIAWRIGVRLRSSATRLAEIVKNHWRAVIAFSAVLVIFGFGVLLVFLFRYEIKTTNSVWVIRLDRFTGTVEWCHPRGGCYPKR